MGAIQGRYRQVKGGSYVVMLLKSEESKSPEVQSQEPDAEGVHVCWPRLCHSCVVKVFRFEQSVGFTLIPKNLCTITLSTIYLSPNNLDTLNHQSFTLNCMHVGGSLIFFFFFFGRGRSLYLPGLAGRLRPPCG